MINQFSYLGKIIKVIEHDEIGKPKFRALINNLLYFPGDTAQIAAEAATQYLDRITGTSVKSTRVTKPCTADAL